MDCKLARSGVWDVNWELRAVVKKYECEERVSLLPFLRNKEVVKSLFPGCL